MSELVREALDLKNRFGSLANKLAATGGRWGCNVCRSELVREALDLKDYVGSLANKLAATESSGYAGSIFK